MAPVEAVLERRRTRRCYLVVALAARRDDPVVEARVRRALARAPALAERSAVCVVRGVDEARDRLAAPAAWRPAEGARDAAFPAERIVVAAGGDGTANRLATALLAAPSPDGDGGATALAVLPLGTGNALAANLGVSRLGRALRALESGRIRSVDVMRTTHPERPFALVSLSGGIEARFVEFWARMRAPFVHGAVWGVKGGAGPPHAWPEEGVAAPARLTLDGAVCLEAGEEFASVGLYNTRCYAFGREVFPEAHLDDGTGEAMVCQTPAAWATTLLVGRGAGPDAEAEVRIRPWRSARLEHEGLLQVDGDPVSGGDFEVHIEPCALRVLAAR